jgi:hypothetical protein
VFHAILIVSNVLRSIYPFFLTMTLLNIFFELALIPRPIDVSVLSVAISHIVFELPPVNVALRVPKCALTFSFIITPLAFIMCPVSPILYAITMTDNIWNLFGLLLITPRLVTALAYSIL